MTSRIEELLSPDRLRHNWPMKIAPTLESAQIAPHLNIRATYDELQGLIAKRFPDISRLSVRFETLTAAIDHAYPAGVTVDLIDGKQKDAIVAMLEQLETLLWALELSLERDG